ncbi:MAG: RNA degradosome polyphosphate kinase, partial [Geminicoccales bacterium]
MDDTKTIERAAPGLVAEGRYINRELSWLAFNERVLGEAANSAHPLLERLRFLSISASNLDEFYMVRVAGLKGQVAAGVATSSQDGLTPAQQLGAINSRSGELMRNQQSCWRALRQELRENGIVLLDRAELTADDRRWLDGYFIDEVFPVLTPMAIDPAHPFPFIPNLGFSLVLELWGSSENRSLRALLPLPALLPRFIRLPGPEIRFLPLEDLISLYLDRLFPGFDVVGQGY